jgi:hypothetical protein
MRARNPCLFTRRLLRGRYDGFMQTFLQSEPGKLVWLWPGVKPTSDRVAPLGPTAGRRPRTKFHIESRARAAGDDRIFSAVKMH